MLGHEQLSKKEFVKKVKDLGYAGIIMTASRDH